MGREQYRFAKLDVNAVQVLAYASLRHDIEPDRWLVEEQNVRIMQQCCCEIRSHPLSERQLTDGRVHEFPKLKQIGELANAGIFTINTDAVHRRENIVRVPNRQIPP